MREFTRDDFIPKSQKKPTLFNSPKKLTLFDALVEIYTATSDVNNFTEVHTIPELFDWVASLYEHHKADLNLIKVDRTLIKQNFSTKDAIIHLVTAGKDSTAAARKYRDLASQHYLVHVGGVNKIYPTEHKMAHKLYTQFFPEDPYHFIRVNATKITGASESPIKNMFITVLAIEHLGFIPKHITLGGSQKIADISETEVYGDTSKGLVPFFKALNTCYDSDLTPTPYLRDQVEAYEICESMKIPYSMMASCMSQLRFKQMQRKKALERFSKVVDGVTLISGTRISDGRSIFEMTNDDLSKIKLSDLKNIDQVDPVTDYRCIQGCFKCREKALVYSKHFGYQYHPEYIKSCVNGMINWMDKSPNKNRINLTEYFEYVLGIPMSSISSKYHSYIKGESERPEGWKQPKPSKKKAVVIEDEEVMD